MYMYIGVYVVPQNGVTEDYPSLDWHFIGHLYHREGMDRKVHGNVIVSLFSLTYLLEKCTDGKLCIAIKVQDFQQYSEEEEFLTNAEIKKRVRETSWLQRRILRFREGRSIFSSLPGDSVHATSTQVISYRHFLLLECLHTKGVWYPRLGDWIVSRDFSCSLPRGQIVAVCFLVEMKEPFRFQYCFQCEGKGNWRPHGNAQAVLTPDPYVISHMKECKSIEFPSLRGIAMLKILRTTDTLMLDDKIDALCMSELRYIHTSLQRFSLTSDLVGNIF